MSTQINSQPILDNNGQGYIVYAALLTQTGVANPVPTVLQNTTGSTMTWSRNGPGDYTLTSSVLGLFVVAKTAIIIPAWLGVSADIFISNPDISFFNMMDSNTISTLRFGLDSFGGSNLDSRLLNTFIEIRIYQ